MKKTFVSSLLLVASSAFGVTFEHVTLEKLITSPIPGTKIKQTVLQEVVVTEHRREGTLLSILSVSSREEAVRAWAEEELKAHWMKKMQESLRSVRREGGGLIPTIDIPIRLPGPIVGIFGEGGRLDIGGSQSITFGGSKNYTVEAVADPNVRQTWFPDLKMEQHLKVNVKGTIGEKLSVDVDHDSKAQSELQNRIRLSYTGREDEIIQTVEAGDVGLSLPGTKYSSVSGQHKGLFGIKSSSQLGPLSITAIASKEQGEASSEAFRGIGGRVESLSVEDYQYVKQKFYWLGEAEEIGNLELFREVKNPTEGHSYIEADCWIDPSDTSYYSELYYHAFFEQLVRGQDYIFNPPNWIELTYQVQEDQALAVYYITEDGREVGDTSSTTLQLKLIKHEYRNPWHYLDDSTRVVHPTWEYELKNFYNLGAENVVDTSISVSVWRKVSGAADTDIDEATSTTYLRLLGLDLNGDGRVDDNRIHNNKYLVFPFYYYPDSILSPKPFLYLPDGTRLPHPDSAIYYETSFSPVTSKYYLVMQYQTSQPTISLPRINIIEESEAVTVGGVQWQRGRDYDIDYLSGTVTLKKTPRPDEKITIDYQWAPLISLASKTLLGMRAAYQLSDIGEIGTTFLYRSVTTPTEKPKPGEEPTRNMLGEIDAQLKFKPEFLTSLADGVPLVETDKSSEFSISGEVAASFPDPNTKNEAYLDDMEGTSISHTFPVNFKAWSFSSVPSGKDTSTFASTLIRWYNPRSEESPRAGDIHEGLPEIERERRETVLQVDFQPDDTSSWAGLSTLLSPTRIDLRTYDNLEIWVHGEEGVLRIDLAPMLSEDGIRRNAQGAVVGYGYLDTEDKEPRDGVLDWDEDTGLDGIDGDDELGMPGDDGNDDYNYSFASTDYSKINGTEGNQKLDTDDLDSDNRLDTENSYFEYEIDLSDTLFLRKRTAADWKLYRIPLSFGETRGTGFPDSASVKYGRLWLSGTSNEVAIQLYSIEITGNRWVRREVSLEDTLSSPVLSDERFYVEVLSNVYDTSYVPPFDPGVDRYGRPMRESSLELIYENVRPGHGAYCYRTIVDPNAKDYTNYSQMAVWLKRDGGLPADFLIRFGSDTLNYYQVRRRVTHSGWEELKIDLNQLSLIKHSVYDTTDARDLEYHLGELGFKGNPTLTRIEWMAIGVANSDFTVRKLTGRLLVNELRLTEPKRDIGTAANARAHMRVADLFDLSAAAERKDSEFRRLTQTSSVGSKTTTSTYSFNGAVNLHKFGMKGYSIPLSVTMLRTVGLPKYGAGNDVELQPEQRWAERTQSENLSYGLSFSKTSSSPNRLLKVTVDPIKLNFSRKYRSSESPDNRDSVYSFSSSASYSYSPKLNPLNLKLLRLSYFPSKIGLSGTYTNSSARSWKKTDTLLIVKKTQKTRNADYSVDVAYSPIGSLRSSYRLSGRRDLKRIQLYRDFNIGREWQRDQTVTLNYDVPLPIFNPRTAYSVSYGENHYVDYDAMGSDSTEYLKITKAKKITADLSLNVFDAVNKLPWVNVEKNRLLAAFKQMIQTPSFAYSRNINSQFFGLLERPSFGFQVGIEEELGDVAREDDLRDQKTTRDVYSVNGGVTLWRLKIKVSGDKSKKQSTYPSVSTNDTWSESTGWPQVNLEVDILKLLGPLARPFTSMNLTSRFSVQRDRAGAQDLLKNETETNSLSPSLRLTLKKGIKTTVGYRHTEKEDQRYDIGQKKTQQKADAVDVTLGYSFSAPTGIKLPLFSRIRFKSNLDASLTGGWEQDLITQFTPGAEPLETTNSTRFSIRPSLSYRFSSAVSGNLRAWFSQRKDRKRASTNRDLGIDFSATFRF